VQAPVDLGLRRQVLDGLGVLVAVVRPDGMVVLANAALEQQLGWSRRSLEGVDFSLHLTEPSLLCKALAGIQGREFDTLRFASSLKCLYREPLPVHVQVSSGMVADEVVVELWPLEQQLKQDRDDRQWEQAQATKDLLRTLAHEVKNPLGGIRGAAQLLQMQWPDPQWQEYTQVILREVDRLQALVDRLLAPHRQARVLGDVNIHEVCEQVLGLVRAEYPRGLQIVRDYDTSIPEFRGDKAELVQALLNVVQNATQALTERMAEGDACITLRTRVARQVTLGRQRHRLVLQLHVIDNGPGIPEALRERIFFPLVTGRQGGSGLGLPLAQTLVQRHQGVIECESKPGHTDFCVLIPLL